MQTKINRSIGGTRHRCSSAARRLRQQLQERKLLEHARHGHGLTVHRVGQERYRRAGERGGRAFVQQMIPHHQMAVQMAQSA